MFRSPEHHCHQHEHTTTITLISTLFPLLWYPSRAEKHLYHHCHQHEYTTTISFGMIEKCLCVYKVVGFVVIYGYPLTLCSLSFIWKEKESKWKKSSEDEMRWKEVNMYICVLVYGQNKMGKKERVLLLQFYPHKRWDHMCNKRDRVNKLVRII